MSEVKGVRVTEWIDGELVDVTEWHNLSCKSGVTLRAACVGEGLLVSGTSRQRAKRLVDAGLTAALVEERYGWRARTGVAR